MLLVGVGPPSTLGLVFSMGMCVKGWLYHRLTRENSIHIALQESLIGYLDFQPIKTSHVLKKITCHILVLVRLKEKKKKINVSLVIII